MSAVLDSLEEGDLTMTMFETQHTYHCELCIDCEQNAMDSLTAFHQFVEEVEHDVLRFKWAVFAADHALAILLLMVVEYAHPLPVMKQTKRGVRVIGFWEAFRRFKKVADSITVDRGGPSITRETENDIRNLHDVARNELWHYQPNKTRVEHPMDYVRPLLAAVDVLDMIQRTLPFRRLDRDVRGRANSIISRLRIHLEELASDYDIVQHYYGLRNTIGQN